MEEEEENGLQCFLTVRVVCGRHVGGGTAIDDGVGRQVGKVGKRPHQVSSIWQWESRQ